MYAQIHFLKTSGTTQMLMTNYGHVFLLEMPYFRP